MVVVTVSKGVVVFKELIFNSFYLFGVKELIFNSFYFWGVVVLKELVLKSLRGWHCLPRSDSKEFLLWVGVIVMKELIFNTFYFEGVVVLKELILTVSTLGEGVVVLKELIFNSFYFWGREWWC